MSVHQRLLETDLRLVAAILVLLAGLILGLMVRRWVRSLLKGAGIPEAVEGTSFERGIRRMGFTTVGAVAELASWFVYLVAVLFALRVAMVLPGDLFWLRVTSLLPRLFIAVFVLVAGYLVGEKAEIAVQEYLDGVKLPQTSLFPLLVKYAIFYIAVLVALGQVGASTGALLVLLGLFGIAVLVGVALAVRDLLPAVAAGVFILLREPYSIGDTIAVGDHEGVVQEVDVYVTKIEGDSRQYVIPNHLVLREGVVRVIT